MEILQAQIQVTGKRAKRLLHWRSKPTDLLDINSIPLQLGYHTLHTLYRYNQILNRLWRKGHHRLYIKYKQKESDFRQSLPLPRPPGYAKDFTPLVSVGIEAGISVPCPDDPDTLMTKLQCQQCCSKSIQEIIKCRERARLEQDAQNSVKAFLLQLLK